MENEKSLQLAIIRDEIKIQHIVNANKQESTLFILELPRRYQYMINN